jgi:hypothetical protein
VSGSRKNWWSVERHFSPLPLRSHALVEEYDSRNEGNVSKRRESLVRLLLVNPASAATAERSFSGLRRLKTYLRSSCGQLRLNNLAICHVHKEILDTLDISSLMNEFVLANDKRAAVFGHLSR